MSRNSTGDYSLPGAVNPVVAGTTITDTWANTTLSDVAAELTNSLDRSGRGGMLAPLKNVDGNSGAPAFAFSNESTLGLYRSASGVMSAAVGGALRLSISATLLLSTVPVDFDSTLNVDGAATFNSTLQVTGAATLNGATAVNNTLNVTGAATFASASFTSATFSGNATAAAFIPSGATVPSNGMYLSAANTVAWSSNTTLRASVNASGVWTFATAQFDIGPSANPNLSVQNNSGTASTFRAGAQTGQVYFGSSTDSTVNIQQNASNVITIASASRAVSIAAPVSGTALTVNAASANWAAAIIGQAGITSFTGTSLLGLRVAGSTATTDYSGIDFSANNQSNPIARIGVIAGASGSSIVLGTSNTYASGITNSAVTINHNGVVTIGIPTSGSPLIVGGAENGVTFNGSGANNSILVFGNVTNAERVRITVTNSRDYSLSIDGGANTHFKIDSSGRWLNPANTIVAFRARKTVTDSTSTAGSTIAFDTEDFDQGNNFASNIFTAPVDGLYEFECCAVVTNGSAGTSATILSIVGPGNYSTQLSASIPASATGVANGTLLCRLTATQTVKVVTNTNLDANHTVAAGITTFFSGRLIG